MNETRTEDGSPAERARETADHVRESMENLRERTSDKISQAKDTIQESGRSVGDYLEGRRAPTADALDRTASGIRDRAGRGTKAVYHAADRSAERLERTANYLRTRDADAMLSDTKDLVKRHPTEFLVAALALGFLIGRLLSSNRRT